MSNIYHWGNNLVVVLKDKGNEALIKIIKSPRYKTDARLNVPWNQLIQAKTKEPARTIAPNSCPNCRTPEMISGIECPGCGFKEWINLYP